MGPASISAARHLVFFGCIYQYMLITIWLLHFVGASLAGFLFVAWAKGGKQHVEDLGCQWPTNPGFVMVLSTFQIPESRM
jgi:hypothetical protein